MKLFQLVCVTTFMLFAVTANAAPAEVISFNADTICVDADANFLNTTSERHMVITNNGKGLVNLTAKGVCPTTSKKAVKFDNEDFDNLIGCNGGVAGVLPFWTYHMQPSGRYTLKCSSK